MNHELIGIIAGGISFFAYGIYILTTVFPKRFFGQATRPNRATWWILTLIGGLIVESYWNTGAQATIWVALSYFIGPLIIALISLNKKWGVGGWKGIDKWCLVGAIVSIIFRLLYKDYPAISLIFNLAIDFLGIVPTLMKSYFDPVGEDRIAWSIEFIACFIDLFAIESWKFVIWIHPIYLLTMNGLIVLLLVKNKWFKDTFVKLKLALTETKS